MGSKNFLIDTNITIYYFGLLLSKESEVFMDEVVESQYYISVINRIELLGNNDIGQEEQNALDAFINNAVVIDLNEEVITETIQLRKRYSIKLPDAIIAATCIVNNLQLITNNSKDYNIIKELEVIQVKLAVDHN